MTPLDIIDVFLTKDLLEIFLLVFIKKLILSVVVHFEPFEDDSRLELQQLLLL